jgi:hypothetical protein
VSPQRTLWTDLRAIDQAIVPRLASLVSRLRRGTRAVRSSVSRGRGGPVQTMRRLDDAFASRGVLGLVRDVPQVGIVGLALLLSIASVVTAIRLGHHGEDNSALDLPTVGGTHIATVGPLPGETISSYLAAAQAAITQQAAESPTQATYAVADFETGRTPQQVADALPGVAPALVYVRVHVPGDTKTFPSSASELSAYAALKQPLRVSNLPADANSAFVALASALDRAAADNAQFAGSIAADASADELAQKDAQLKDAAHYRAEAAALRHGCACIYAAVVNGPAETLLHILDSGKVRAIDPASPGLKLNEITWVPLLPDTKVRQPVQGPSGP